MITKCPTRCAYARGSGPWIFGGILIAIGVLLPAEPGPEPGQLAGPVPLIPVPVIGFRMEALTGAWRSMLRCGLLGAASSALVFVMRLFG